MRHLFLGALVAQFPDVRFWALGQANAPIVNGLGWLDLLPTVWVDGAWWLADALAERTATIEQGLITMLNIGSGKTMSGAYRVESFFTTEEMMAANLRARLRLRRVMAMA